MSKEDKPIHYEPHPVSPERKAELVAKGVRIVDAALAPPDEAGMLAEQAERRSLIEQLVNLSIERMGAVSLEELRDMVASTLAAKDEWLKSQEPPAEPQSPVVAPEPEKPEPEPVKQAKPKAEPKPEAKQKD